ncbi:hypothetical protein ACEUZ9_002198 [Paracoccus litorisediminis]|uniref:hypothetical protein n=1 Tax=Paracoccus litorisediminis TaxID=2006130 RepID=UPI00372EF358
MNATTPMRDLVAQMAREGLTCSETAERLGIPAGTVRWHRSKIVRTGRADEIEAPARPVDPSKRTAVVRSVPTGSAAMSESRVSLHRMPWDEPEAPLAARPETDPRHRGVFSLPRAKMVELEIDPAIAIAAIREAMLTMKEGVA